MVDFWPLLQLLTLSPLHRAVHRQQLRNFRERLALMMQLSCCRGAPGSFPACCQAQVPADRRCNVKQIVPLLVVPRPTASEVLFTREENLYYLCTAPFLQPFFDPDPADQLGSSTARFQAILHHTIASPQELTL